MKKILYVLGGVMKYGGTENFIMNFIRHFDHDMIRIDFVQCGKGKGVFDEELKSYGSRIFYLPLKRSHPFRFSKEFKEVLINGQYDAVHGMIDTANSWILKIAKDCNVSIRIAHSHNTDIQSNNIVKYMINVYWKHRIPLYANCYMACSTEAGEWLFGKDSKFYILPNAIEYEKYKFNKILRTELRHKYDVDDKFVIGHIGQFRAQKNHMFLLEVFKAVRDIVPSAHLVCVGSGPLLDGFKEKVRAYELEDGVTIIPGTNAANRIYNMFDVFAFPSKHEGLGIVLVEAQTNGLKCVVSDVVPKGADILGKCDFTSLDESPVAWAEKILNNRNSVEMRFVERSVFEKTGYDIEEAAMRLQNYYLTGQLS